MFIILLNKNIIKDIIIHPFYQTLKGYWEIDLIWDAYIKSATYIKHDLIFGCRFYTKSVKIYIKYPLCNKEVKYVVAILRHINL